MDYYDTIREIPAIKYYDVVEKGDYKAMLKTSFKGKLTSASENKLKLAFVDLMDEDIEEFGLPEKARKYYELKKKLIITLCNSIIKDDRFLENKADILQSQMKDLMPENGKSMRYRTMAAKLGQQGYQITMNTTLFEYKSILESLDYGKKV